MYYINRELERVFLLFIIPLILFSCTPSKSEHLNQIDFSYKSCISNTYQRHPEIVKLLNFKPDQKLNLGFFKGSIWIQVKLINYTVHKKELIISSNDKFNRQYKLYKSDSQGKLIADNTVKTTKYNDSRTYNFVLPNFKIVLAPKEQATYYIYTESDGRVIAAAPHIFSHNHFLEVVNQETIRDSFLYASLVIILLINLVYTFINKKRIFIYYTFYVFFTCLLYLGLDGYLFNGMLPLNIADHLIFISLRLFMLSFLLFTVELLDIKTEYPKLYKYSIWHCGILFSGMTLYQFIFFNTSIQHLHILENGVAFSWILLISMMVIISIKKMKPELKFYIVGLSCYFGFIFLGLIFTHLMTSAKINVTYTIFYKIGSIIEVAIFTYTIVVILTKTEVEVNQVRATALLKETEYKKKLNLKLIESHTLDTKVFNQRLKHNLNTPLTKRELEVLVELCKGKKNKEISKSLFISVNTVRSHLLNIYEKMEVESRTQAVKMAENLSRSESE